MFGVEGTLEFGARNLMALVIFDLDAGRLLGFGIGGLAMEHLADFLSDTHGDLSCPDRTKDDAARGGSARTDDDRTAKTAGPSFGET